ncbi:unnamed protein product [Porites lobata]|uniref:THAP-type domain-containing protein n=1 Tax=Porites lobata TaxID=104759 RepID=A0ABN8NCN7_9CNID|nr:unnamed protein product [Porites lobata]
MAANKEDLKKRGGRYCVAGTPNQESCKNTSYTPGITMHLFPTEPKCRAQWIKFVQRHRVDFGEPINQYASLCWAHFEPSCFENSLARSMGFKVKNNLETGSILTRHAVDSRCLQRIQSKEVKKAKGSATTAIQQTVTAKSTPSSTPSPSAPTLIQTDTAPSTPIWTPSPSASTAPSFQLQTDTAPSTPITTASPSPLTAIQTAPSNATPSTPVSTSSPSSSTATSLPHRASSCAGCSKYRWEISTLKRLKRRLSAKVKSQKAEIKKLKLTVKITEENSEISDFEAKASNDYFVWSSAPSDSGTDDDYDWNTGAAQDDAESTESDH